MPPKEVITKKDIMKASIKIVREFGINEVNARKIAKELGCSTKPLFRQYKDMDDLKNELNSCLKDEFNSFANKGVDKNNLLISFSIHFALYAKEEPNIFSALFMGRHTKNKTIEAVISEPWNRRYLESAKIAVGDNNEETARVLFRDIWLYTYGLATQLVIKGVVLSEEEISTLITNIYGRLK